MNATGRMVAVAVLWVGTLLGSRAAERTGPQCTGATAASQNTTDHSRRCLACHDGVIAANIMAAGTDARGLHGSGNHPVMMSYEQAYFHAPARFIAPARLDPRVKLISGTVQCVSCHAISEIGEWMLVKPNVRSALCLSCHRK